MPKWKMGSESGHQGESKIRFLFCQDGHGGVGEEEQLLVRANGRFCSCEEHVAGKRGMAAREATPIGLLPFEKQDWMASKRS